MRTYRCLGVKQGKQPMCRGCTSHSAIHVALQGIEKHGVGQWRDIGAELLPRWDDTTLRLKAARLLGSQSLARYMRWKGDRCSFRALIQAPALCLGLNLRV